MTTDITNLFFNALNPNQTLRLEDYRRVNKLVKKTFKVKIPISLHYFNNFINDKSTKHKKNKVFVYNPDLYFDQSIIFENIVEGRNFKFNIEGEFGLIPSYNYFFYHPFEFINDKWKKENYFYGRNFEVPYGTTTTLHRRPDYFVINGNRKLIFKSEEKRDINQFESAKDDLIKKLNKLDKSYPFIFAAVAASNLVQLFAIGTTHRSLHPVSKLYDLTKSFDRSMLILNMFNIANITKDY